METGGVEQALGGYTGSSPHTENTSENTVHVLGRSSFLPEPHLTSGVFRCRHRCQSWKGPLRTPSASPLSCRGTDPRRDQGNSVAWLGFVECLHSSRQCVLGSFIHIATHQRSVEYLLCTRQHTKKTDIPIDTRLALLHGVYRIVGFLSLLLILTISLQGVGKFQ